ncbi:protein C19orf12 homolog [Hetaerina americana]|uniref:protein C19orf12 homolog n=1 Tax=Hetaerina americana TaxID=62018 RepID=UPI003A7F1260
MAVRSILAEVSKLSELEGVRVTLRNSLSGGVTVGCAATAGSVALGPVGLLLGGVLGSVLTTWSKWGSYRSLISVISEDLTPRQQEQLVESLQLALNQVSREDLLKLLVLITSGGAQAALREIAVSSVREFACQELGFRLS